MKLYVPINLTESIIKQIMSIGYFKYSEFYIAPHKEVVDSNQYHYTWTLLKIKTISGAIFTDIKEVEKYMKGLFKILCQHLVVPKIVS
jgi:hypothetical protein